jgi:4-amino-4-deoxy-L-arabinose transferase-like glycosyltransferase
LGVERPSDRLRQEPAPLLTRHQAWIAFALVLGVAATLRILRVGEGLWFEEVFWVRSATSSLRNALTLSGLTHAHPPFYVILLKIWIWVGGHADVWLRLSSVFCGVASVGVIYLWAAPRFGVFAGLLGSFFVAVSTFHVHYSVELRPQALMVLLVVTLVWMVDRWLDEPDRRIFLGVALLLEVALVLTHPQGLFIAAAVALYGFAVRPRRPQHLVAWTVVHFVVIAAVSWWLPVMLLQRGHVPAAAFRAAESALPPGQWLSVFGPSAAHVSPLWAAGGGVLALVAASVGLFRAWRVWPGLDAPVERAGPVSLVFTRPLFFTMILSLCLAILLPLTQLWLTAITDRYLDALIDQLGWTYLIVAGLFGVLVGIAMLRQRLRFSVRLSLPLFVVGASIAGLWTLGLDSPDHSLRDLLHLLPFLAVFVGRGLEPRHWTSAVIAAVLLASLAAPSLVAAPHRFLPRQDLRGCARVIEGYAAPIPGVANFVIPMWDREALEYYLGEGTATGIMSSEDLPPSGYLPNIVNVVMTRGAAKNREVFAQAFTRRLEKTHVRDATVSLRRVQMIRYIRH